MIGFEELCDSIHEDLNGRINLVAWDRERYRVEFECDDWENYDRRRRFDLLFSDMPEATVAPSLSDSITVLDSHPLLWQHNEPHQSMFFSSRPPNPRELVGRLYEVHQRLFGHWRSLADCLHADAELLSKGHGLLAQGPQPVIEEYAKAIGDQLRHSILSAYVPRGGYQLALFDSAFVVFREVHVTERS
jgi:hypothetical protein